MKLSKAKKAKELVEERLRLCDHIKHFKMIVFDNNSDVYFHSRAINFSHHCYYQDVELKLIKEALRLYQQKLDDIDHILNAL